MEEVTEVRRVRIKNGCINCGLCEDLSPQVFRVRDTGCEVRASAENFYGSCSAQILQAAKDCPVNVIEVE
jgi:ferredoxin